LNPRVAPNNALLGVLLSLYLTIKNLFIKIKALYSKERNTISLSLDIDISLFSEGYALFFYGLLAYLPT
jgi:hypothetical protein